MRYYYEIIKLSIIILCCRADTSLKYLNKFGELNEKYKWL